MLGLCPLGPPKAKNIGFHWRKESGQCHGGVPQTPPTPKVRIGTLPHGIWMLQMGCFAPTTHVLLLVPLGCGPLISQHLRYIEKMCSEPLEGFSGFFSRDSSDPHQARRPNRAKNRKIAPWKANYVGTTHSKITKPG